MMNNRFEIEAELQVVQQRYEEASLSAKAYRKMYEIVSEQLHNLAELTGYELENKRKAIDVGKRNEVNICVPMLTGHKTAPVDYSHDHTEQLAMASKGNSLSTMVGGSHYQTGSGRIQPIEFYNANPQLNFQQCNMIKYAYRHKDKNGLQDLLKVIHYALLEADLNYCDNPEEVAKFKQQAKELFGG